MQIIYYSISAEEAGQRVDNFLLKTCKHTPKSRIYRAIRSAEVRVNKGRVKAHHRLQAGDRVRCPQLQAIGGSDASMSPATAAYQQHQIQQLQQAIVYQDQQLLVINKPPGMAVHGGTGEVCGLITALRNTEGLNHPYLELVHRLDKGTSGCLLVAKQRAVLLKLHQHFKSNCIQKTYLALLKGKLKQDTIEINQALSSSSQRTLRRKTVIDVHGKPATTQFQVLRRLADATLVKVTPKTGRTHQIRVHAAALGHPILGDDRYGDRVFNQQQKDVWGKRMYLHAAALELQAVDGLDLQGIGIPPAAAWRERILAHCT